MDGMKEGFRYIRNTPVVFTLVKVVAVNAIFGLPFLAMMPVVARNVLHTGAAGYGSLLACVGVGAFGGALALAAMGKVKRGRIFMVSTYSFALLLIAFSFTRHLGLAAVILVGIGLVMLLTGSLANGLMQSIAPDELRGRVVSAYVFTYVGLAPIGSFLTGAAADLVGVQWALRAGAMVMLVFTWRAFSKHPELRAV
jgi:MFS family permease